ncbi:alpha/beta hydrolase [Aquimarina sp. 2201CG1-2-11]|uniref:alpha/beta fold hydrolase n=1 Tax=Aquimarina discodermiae TaxID=3231043 RepID=UPI003461813F
MKKNILLLDLVISIFVFSQSYAQVKGKTEFNTPYGDNENVGKFIEINDAKIYYEEYGKGEPLILIHGCGANIKSMKYQIEYFRNKYRVIIADSRGQGKSELKTDSITYNQMANDWEGLVNHLKLDSINILGWSDGGIIGLKMGINQKVKVKKIVAMGANLRPDTTAVNSWAPNEVKENLMKVKKMIEQGDTYKNWNLELQLDQLLLNQPNISHSELKKIEIPVLIIAGDRDIIKNEHSVEIFNNLTKGQLCIMPGTNHWAPSNKSVIFNEIAHKFLSESFDYTKK